MLIHALNRITTPQINQLLEHTMYITSAKNVDVNAKERRLTGAVLSCPWCPGAC